MIIFSIQKLSKGPYPPNPIINGKIIRRILNISNFGIVVDKDFDIQ